MPQARIKIQRLIAILAALSLITGQITAVDDDVTSKLQIHIPTELSKEGGYEHREAMFGAPPYGGAIIENVYYTDDPMCTSEFDNTSGYPERKDEKGNPLPWQPPFILMIDRDRGYCNYEDKVRNGQLAGAAAVIIADTFCLCKFAEICAGEFCEDEELVMLDDGTGSDISIPSMLLFKQDADPVKATLFMNKPVRMELRWSLPQNKDIVNYDIWTVPGDVTSENLQLEFRDAALALGKHANFTPHMYLYDGLSSGCISRVTGRNSCHDVCTNNGRYCSYSNYNISGGDVVTESLRRLCIWKLHGSDGIGQAWWEYVDYFIDKCGLESFTAEDCILDSMKQAGINSDAVSKCMNESGGTQEDVKNKLLQAELDRKTKTGVVIFPDVHVNGAAVRGALIFKNMFIDICDGYADGTAPTICTNCAKCHDVKTCVKNGYCFTTGTTSKPISKTYFLWSILGLIVFSIIGVFVGYRYHQKRMQKQIRMVLSEYMPVGKDGDRIDFTIDDDGIYS